MIQVIKRVVDILNFVAENPEEPKGLGVIANAVGLNPGTCANIIKALCEYDFLEQVEKKKGYILGPRIYYLAKDGPYRKDIVKTLEPYLFDLATKVKETVLVATLHQGKRFVLIQVDGNKNVAINKNFFFQENIYNTATGRLLLAFLSPSELEIFIKKHGLPDKKIWPEATTKKKLFSFISNIRKKGMVIHITKSDVAGIAFPVKQKDRVIAALGLFLPSFRFKGEYRKHILKNMKETSEKMSQALTEK